MTSAEWTIEAEHMVAARDVSREHALASPLIAAPWLGNDVWLKLEMELPTGSFKVRGALTYLTAKRQAARELGLLAASAGNHGLGLAYAARLLSIPLRVFVSSSLAEVKLNGMRRLGAQLELCDETEYDAVEARARATALESGALFASPFDDPLVAAGNGTPAMEEVLAALPNVRRVVVPVGGGGLLAGVGAAIASARADVEVVGVESAVSAAMARSMRGGRALTTLEPLGPTLAEGLEGGICASTLRAALAAGVVPGVVDEEDIATAMVLLRRELGRVVEGSGAASVAWLRRFEKPITNGGGGPTVLWVTGGNVDGQRVESLAAGWRPGQAEEHRGEE